ncbi:integrase, catalytic region, zinc finger, CCHC-type containing protein [Tanacetum coccineum]
MSAPNYVHNTPVNSENGDDYVEDPDPITRISKLDVSDLLHLHPNDSSALSVVSIKLKGTENYQVWSCAMLLALEGKNKTGFIDGSCKRSNTYKVLGRQWDRVNAVVLGWILNSISEELFLGQIFSKRDRHVWEELKETYDNLNALWKQFDAMIDLPKCVCNASKGFKKHNQLMKLMQFLMGLDDSYMQTRSSILSREVILDVRSAYATISSEESRKVASSSVSGSSQRSHASAFVSNVPNRNIGYPADFGKKKFGGQNQKNKGVSNNNSVGSSSSYGFSDEQIATLVSLMRDNKIGKNVQANMTAGSKNRPSMLNKENYVPWSSRLLHYAKSRPNGKLIYNSIINGPYVRRMNPEPSDAARTVPVPETFTSTDGESIKSYYHHFSKLKNDFKRNKHFPEKTGSNLKFLNNLQPEWSQHVTIVHQTKDLHTADYTQLYDFLKYNQKEVDELRAERLAKAQDPLALMNPGVQNDRNQNGVIVVPDIANQNGNGKVVAARAEGNTQLLIAQKEEAGIQLQAKEFDLMAAAADLDEIEESDKAPVYDLNGLAEVQLHDNCYNDEIFNTFTQEEQYTELLESIPEPHQVQQNDSNVTSIVSSMEQGGGTVEQHPENVEETRVLYDSLYNNLAIGVEKVNSVNRKLRETNADLTAELARYKNQEKCFEISQEKYDKLERCYQQSVYQEQCLTKKINALHLSLGKQITTLNEEISNLNKQLSKEKLTVSSLQEENKRLKSDFKICKDELLDKQIQLENKIKELDNILVKMGQSIQTMHMLSSKPDSFYHTEHKMAFGYQNPFYLKQAQQKQHSLYNGKVLLERHDPPTVYDSEETLELALESQLKMKQLNKEIKPTNYTKINHLSGVFVSQTAKSREELYFSNTSKTAIVSKTISIPNEDFSDDTTPSVAQKFLNEVKSTIVTLQQADESLAKHKALELDIERLLRAVISQNIVSIVQNATVVETSDLQTELDRMKERLENCIFKKEKEYDKLWNDWYKKCKECNYDKISYDKAYNDMQQKIKRLQAQLGDQKEFQIKNYAKENAHLKTAYKNLFDSINVTHTHTKSIIDSLQNKLHDTIYENAKLRAQLFDKVSEQKDTTRGTSANTKFAKQSILGKPPSSSRPKLYVVTPLPKSMDFPKVGEMNALSNQVTSNSVPSSQELKVIENDNVITLGMFRIDPHKTSRKDNFVPNKHVKASVRTKPITVS